MAPSTSSDTLGQTESQSESRSESPEINTSASSSAEEVAAVIDELEQYRARLVEDFTTTAKKAKLPKSMTMAQLKSHPEILKIDTALAQLRGEEPTKAES
ncbi:MAG: hypothetical protein ACFB0D_24915 [Phormidesmis sp.]